MLLVHCQAALRSGWRSRGARVVLVLGVVVMLIAWLAAAFSARQPQTVALDVGISTIRLVSVFLGLYWIQELICKDIERKTVYTVLAYPQARYVYLLGRWLGVQVLLFCALFLLAFASLISSELAVGAYQQGTAVHTGWEYWITIGYVYLDLLVITSFATLVATVATVPMMAFFVGLGFAVAARGLGPALSYLLYLDGGDKALAPTYLPVLRVVQWVLPDLSRLDVRSSVLYGQWPATGELWMTSIMAISYSILILWLAIRIFKRREFI